MASKVAEYLDNLTAHGEISFTLHDIQASIGISRNAAISAIKRLKKCNKIASPSRGYYLILTPPFRKKGCLPADFFIDDLMRHLSLDYYVGLLSAAMFFGAGHHQPQMMQIMIQTEKRDIQCGEVNLQFIRNSQLFKTPLTQIKTQTGYMNISTPEGTAKDMIRYMRQCGGINRIVTVIEELSESMEASALEKMAQQDKGQAWIRRLGYLLDLVKTDQLSTALYHLIDTRSEFVPLVPYASMTGSPRNKKWRIAINTTIESDLDDT